MGRHHKSESIQCDINHHLLYVHRLKANLSTLDVCRALDVRRTTIHNWEHGRHKPSIYQLVKLSKLYKTDVRRYIDGVYKQALFVFEAKIALWIDNNHDCLENLTKDDIAMIRLLENLEVIEKSETTEPTDDGLSENPLHTILKE